MPKNKKVLKTNNQANKPNRRDTMMFVCQMDMRDNQKSSVGKNRDNLTKKCKVVLDFNIKYKTNIHKSIMA